MNTDRLNRWLTLGANIGVLVGIVFLVLEFRQNYELIELQILKQDATDSINHSLEVLPENFVEIWRKTIESPEELTRTEIYAVDQYMWARTIVHWRSIYELYERGLIDESTWRRLIKEDVATYYSHRFGRIYWADNGGLEGVFPQDVAEYIDQLLVDTPDGAYSEWVDSVQQRLQAEAEYTRR